MSQAPYSLEQTANIIAEYISDEIKEYFEKTCNENVLSYHDLLDSWAFSLNISNTVSLPTLIMYVLDTCLKNKSEKDAFTQAKLLKKNRKDYFYRTIRQEIGELAPTPNNPKYIETEWCKLNDPYIRFSTETTVDLGSKEEFFASKSERIKAWFKDADSYLFQFEYFYVLPDKRRRDCFIQDLSVDILSLICNEFYRNKFGFMTKSPDINFGMENLPIVNWQTSLSKLQFQVENNKIVVFEELKTNNNQWVKIIMDEIAADCSSEEKINSAIIKIEAEYNSGVRVRTLDTKDMAIYSAVFNNMTIETATSEPLDMTLPDLAADVYGNTTQITKRMYADLLQRLTKLAHIRITSSVKDINDNFVSESIISFFDLTLTVNTDSDSSGTESTIKTIRIGDNALSRDFSSLSNHEFINMNIQFMPSYYTKNMWKNNVHDQISTRLYKRISSQKGKLIAQLLQKERMRIYPETEIVLPIKFFRENIRFSSPNNDRIKKELIAEMDLLKEMAIQIKDFRFVRSDVTINFLPLSKEEKLYYKVED